MSDDKKPKLEIVPSEPAHYEPRSAFEGLAKENVVGDDVEATLKAEGLDWTVEKRQMFIKGEDDKTLVPVPNRTAILKMPMRRILGTAGKLFTPIQNLEAFRVLQSAIDEFGATIETCGELGDGDRVWMLLGLPQKGKHPFGKTDDIKPYFLVANAHTSEKSMSLSARFTSIRVICQNTLEAAIRGDRASVSIPHHKNSADRLQEIQKVVAAMYLAHSKSMDVYQAMARQKVVEADVFAYLRDVYKLRDSEKDAELSSKLSKSGAAEHEGRLSKVFDAREQTMWLVDNGKGTGRTVWGVYNAVTEYIDHVSILKKNGQLTKNGFETAVFGYGAYQKQKALDLAIQRWGIAA